MPIFERLRTLGPLLLLLIGGPTFAADCTHEAVKAGAPPFRGMCAGSYTVRGAIAPGAEAVVVSRAGNVVVEGDIGADSRVELRAPNGAVTVRGNILSGAQVCLSGASGVSVTGTIAADKTQVYWFVAAPQGPRPQGPNVKEMEGGVCPHNR